MADSSPIPIDTSPLIREAVKLVGSQARLARALGISQPRVNQLARRTSCCSAEVAIAVERATQGAIPRWKLRPDLWKSATQAKRELS
ncbi:MULTISPECIES: YdaS family helix-turn-helix protein [unclassified Methylobacterium]|uniref:transcriptional regulator n=1 Tax=Methylobacterium TaxID=407 RepID=UPI000CB1C7EA|nr:MAG: Cro/Cl family transcriptional regulator [Methylobacterium sp. CG09_land_8_20_14_0_10_71_15]PIU15692.1 MAG: Cro/Cl family transcriptional regulator [Methylobacterium sp. CG08_land_8_20_14_0_20_71_15]